MLDRRNTKIFEEISRGEGGLDAWTLIITGVPPTPFYTFCIAHRTPMCYPLPPLLTFPTRCLAVPGSKFQADWSVTVLVSCCLAPSSTFMSAPASCAQSVAAS